MYEQVLYNFWSASGAKCHLGNTFSFGCPSIMLCFYYNHMYSLNIYLKNQGVFVKHYAPSGNKV